MSQKSSNVCFINNLRDLYAIRVAESDARRVNVDGDVIYMFNILSIVRFHGK